MSNPSLIWQHALARCDLAVQAFETNRAGVLVRFVFRDRMLQLDVPNGGALPTVFCCCQLGVPVHHVTSFAAARRHVVRRAAARDRA